MKISFSGSGPGAQARDGCSVELYRLLPYLGDLDLVHDCLRRDASVLELGCGAGRLTRKLLEWGLAPTSVDNSAEMLEHLPRGASAVQGDIETLSLGRTFDIVLLASCLVNHADASLRDAFIACAARHARRGTILLVERQNTEWLRTVKTGWSGQAGPARLVVDGVRRDHGLTHVRLRYVIGREEWTHEFTEVALEPAAIEQLLATHGFHTPVWRGPAQRWVAAAYDA